MISLLTLKKKRKEITIGSRPTPLFGQCLFFVVAVFQCKERIKLRIFNRNPKEEQTIKKGVFGILFLFYFSSGGFHIPSFGPVVILLISFCLNTIYLLLSFFFYFFIIFLLLSVIDLSLSLQSINLVTVFHVPSEKTAPGKFLSLFVEFNFFFLYFLLVFVVVVLC